jgi:2-phospho-L-lactate guanylyltransferase
MHAGILPLKDPSHAKRRLAERFDEAARLSIAQALIADALDLAAETPEISWWVVSDSSAVLDEARARGFAIVQDAGTDLNAALVLALAAVGATEAPSATIVPGDLPLATSADLRDLLDTGSTSDVVVVPSRGGGTNGLYLSPPTIIEPRFGPFSLRAHIAAAEETGVRCTILTLERLALDLDTPEDAERIAAESSSGTPSRTVALLRELGEPG